ncbi:MAG TPA: helix-turn-helix domain-containing protein [Candidatus Binatia bacterium]|jgi:AraC-like DNA-binding protein|nr:helix-turn-helix domain-containing protein [Candidatus Binatia bacterium]
MSSPARVPLVRVAGLVPAIRFLIRQGVRVERFLERAGLSPRVLLRPEGLVPLHLAARFLDDIARVEGCPTLGLQFGNDATLDDLGTFGQVIARASTLRQLLESLFMNAPAYNSGVSWWLEEHGPYMRLCHSFSGDPDGSFVQVSQSAISLARNTLRRIGGPRWHPVALQLSVGTACRRIPDDPVLEGIPMRIDPRVSAVTFDPELFALTIPQARIAPRFDSVALDHWRDRGPATEFPAIVLQILQTLSQDGVPPSVGETSAAIGMSVRTLQRWLAAAGSSFEALIGTTRLVTARHLLDNTDAKVVEIALELGYSDHAHFTRAFRRWTGLSPIAYRRARLTTPTAATG